MPRLKSPNGRFEHYDFYIANSEKELNYSIQNEYYEAKGDINKASDLSTLVVFDKLKTGRLIALRSPLYILKKINESNDQYWQPHKINRTQWVVIANSEQNKQDSFDGPARYIIDGDNSKFWHSKFNDGGDGHDDRPRKTDPFQFTINLGKETTFKSFTYMPRAAGVNGKFGHYEFYAAQTSEELYMKIRDKNYLAKGDFDKNSPISSFVIFNQLIKAQFVALLSLDHDQYATCAKFYLFEEPSSDSTKMDYKQRNYNNCW